jgi:hypothetical protein
MSPLGLKVVGFWTAAAVALTGCGVELEVATSPVSQTVPVTAVGVEGYVELPFDVPKEAQGDIVIEEVGADVTVVNASHGTTMTFTVRVSDRGTATSATAPYVFTENNKPAYFNSAAVVLPPTPFAAGTSTPQHIASAALAQYLKSPRLWIIVGNRISTLGVGDLPPLELALNNLVLHAKLKKSFLGLAPAGEAAGL